MAGFIDILLRGLMLVGGAVALGGVAFTLAVLRTGPRTTPDPLAVRSLHFVALGAGAVTVAQLATTGLALASLLHALGAPAATPFARTTFALAALARVALGATTALFATVLARRAA